MPEFTNQGNVKITDGAAPGEKRLDVDTQASLQVLEVLTDQVDAETVDVNVLNANLIREGGARVVESGSDANGEYVRFADGTQIAVVRQGGIGSVTTPLGTGFIRSVGTVSWPAAFISAPRTFAFASKSSGNLPIWVGGGTGAATPTAAPSVWINVWTSAADTGNVVERLAVGRWK